MRSIFRSALRILAAVAAVLLAFGWALRQPNIGELPFPQGPRANAALLEGHVRFLASSDHPRNPRHPAALDRAARYIAAEFSRAGAEVSEQPYRAWGVETKNLFTRFGPGQGPRIIVGAHYDVFGDLPGADDNASGVAGLLELTRLLASRRLDSPVELVAFSTEEPPFFGGPEMGSAVHASALRSAGVQVRAMLALEMIGYFTPSWPRVPLPLRLLYPGPGDFISVVGRWADRDMLRKAKKCFRGASATQVVSYSGPVLIGADLSDHRNYWAAGYPAIMVTDTAVWRNPNYHRASDTASSLDYRRMAGVVDAVLSTVIHLAND